MLQKCTVGMWWEISDNLKAGSQMILLILWVIRGKSVGFFDFCPPRLQFLQLGAAISNNGSQSVI